MIHAETRLSRVFVARLDAGEDLHEAVRELTRWHRIDAASIRGQGILGSAVLARYEAEARRYVESAERSGPLELAALTGTVSLRATAGEVREQDVRLHAVLSGADGLTAAGLLVRARAVAVELVVDVYDRADLERVDDAVTGLPLWRAPSRG
jgi:predicted DNA-binding protein with PD1-like motif